MVYPANDFVFSCSNRKSYSEINKPSCSQRSFPLSLSRTHHCCVRAVRGTSSPYCDIVHPFGTSWCPEITYDSKCQKSTTLCLNKCFLKFVWGWCSNSFKISYYKIEWSENLLLPYPEFSWRCHFSSPLSPFTTEDSKSF